MKETGKLPVSAESGKVVRWDVSYETAQLSEKMSHTKIRGKFLYQIIKGSCKLLGYFCVWFNTYVKSFWYE